MASKCSLIVQPGDSFFPLVRAIDKAETSVNITVFRLDDPIILRALVEARARGLAVRALIATSANGWEEQNRRLLKDAKKAGIAVREPAGDSRKTRFHYKILTIDGALSLLLTFNPTRENLHYTRDFGIELHDEKVAAELNRLFDADWHDVPFTPDADSRLLISPYNSRRKMLELLDSATTTIHIADAKVEDEAVLTLLHAKAAAGVDVCILGDEDRQSGARSTLQYRASTRFRLHAKCVIVDATRAAIGSMNLRTQCFDRRREVGILIDDERIVQKLEAVFQGDWEQKKLPSSSAPTVLPTSASGEPATAPLAASGFALISRTDTLRRHPLRAGQTTIGRADDNDIVIVDTKASRYHARIDVDGANCRIADIDSANGTFVNGARVAGTRVLLPGDVIGVGVCEEFRFILL